MDEADTVKTDGQYLYVINQNYAASSQNNVFVLNADPQNPAVVSKIALGNDSALAGMYLSQDGNTMVVVGSNYANMIVYPMVMIAGGGTPFYPGFSNYGVSSFIYVYDVSDKAAPTLTYNYTLTGSYFDSRMIGNDVYVVVSQPADLLNNGTRPAHSLQQHGCPNDFAPQHLLHRHQRHLLHLHHVRRLGYHGHILAPSSMTIMMSGTSNMYVSQSNMYVTCPSQSGRGTDIYRVGIDGLNLAFQAKAPCPATSSTNTAWTNTTATSE